METNYSILPKSPVLRAPAFPPRARGGGHNRGRPPAPLVAGALEGGPFATCVTCRLSGGAAVPESLHRGLASAAQRNPKLLAALSALFCERALFRYR